MATVLRVGGSDPLVVDTWRDAIKLQLLQHIYDCGGNRLVVNIGAVFDEEFDSIEKKYGHRPTLAEYRKALQEMYSAGWVEISEYKCPCCAKQTHTAEEFLKHAVRFRLTTLGASKVPEHIFP